jgi:hypothetical protein
VGRSKKVLLLFAPLPTKQWNLPRATDLGSSFTSFHLLFLKKANADHLELFSPDIIFNSNLENICFHNLFEEKEND